MSTTFKGQFNTILGGFPCIRGYASFKDLAENSIPNRSYQRSLIEEHHEEMKQFLSKGEYLFFPEVILSYTFHTKDNLSISQIIESKGKGTPFKLNSNNTSELTLKTDEKLTRIDGNHRLSAYEQNKDSYGDLLFPFCIVLFDAEDDLKKQNIIFHNINFKQIPLTKEKSLEILFKDNVYNDDELKSLGLEYVITKKILNKIEKNKKDYNKLPFLNYQDTPKRTFMFDAVSFLCKKTNIKTDFEHNEKEVLDKLCKNLKNISLIYKEQYKEKGSIAMFSCLLYYQYNHIMFRPQNWFFQTDIYKIEDEKLKPESLQILYECALENNSKYYWKKVRTFVAFLWTALKNIKNITFSNS